MMKVFLVDDEIVIREGIRTSFPWEKTEYTLVGEAPDGELALPMIRDTSPDILITDIRMPFMDGIELCKIVRTQMPWIGIIILSGYDEFEYARQALQLGVKEYLLKPITAEELRRALDKAAAQIRQERSNWERGERLRQRMDQGRRFLQEKLLSSLYSEDAAESDAEKTVAELRNMGIQLLANRYEVIDATFQPVQTGCDALSDLAESSGGVVFFSPSRAGCRLLVLGDSNEDTEERTYAYAASCAEELVRCGCTDIRLGIGEIVDSAARVLASLQTARHIRHILMAQSSDKPLIVGIREVGDLPSEKKNLTIANEAMYYMSQHFTDPNLMLQDVAGAVGMSNSRFSTVFAQQSGKTFTEYLTTLRLNEAKRLLRETDLGSAQIAESAGYNDPHYFSYLFKKQTGITPGEYRRQHENERG